MPVKEYTINKGINKAVEFKGLKAQYIWWVAGAVIAALVLYAVLYFAGISSFICVPLVLAVCGAAIKRVYGMSKRYGQYGLMKWRARRQLPTALMSGSRRFFIQLFSDYAGTTGRPSAHP
jgi:hypothetical protein